MPLFLGRLLGPLTLAVTLSALTSLRRGIEWVSRVQSSAHSTALLCTTYLTCLFNNQLQNALSPLSHHMLSLGNSEAACLRCTKTKEGMSKDMIKRREASAERISLNKCSMCLILHGHIWLLVKSGPSLLPALQLGSQRGSQLLMDP